MVNKIKKVSFDSIIGPIISKGKNLEMTIKQNSIEEYEDDISLYDFIYDEKYNWAYFYDTIESMKESDDIPANDLKGKYIGTVQDFNEHIKKNVEAAGYGTRDGVVAAAKSLVVDYPLITGKRLRYNQLASTAQAYGYVNIKTDRQNPNTEGIVNSDFYLDCSSFASWALYNGGFAIPEEKYFDTGLPVLAYTGSQKEWAIENGYLKDVGSGVGQPGDYLVAHEEPGPQHITMIVDTFSDGYYCAEFNAWGEGAKVTKRTYDDLSYGNYSLIDMTDYYNNKDNIRNK